MQDYQRNVRSIPGFWDYCIKNPKIGTVILILIGIGFLLFHH